MSLGHVPRLPPCGPASFRPSSARGHTLGPRCRVGLPRVRSQQTAGASVGHLSPHRLVTQRWPSGCGDRRKVAWRVAQGARSNLSSSISARKAHGPRPHRGPAPSGRRETDPARGGGGGAALSPTLLPLAPPGPTLRHAREAPPFPACPAAWSPWGPVPSARRPGCPKRSSPSLLPLTRSASHPDSGRKGRRARPLASLSSRAELSANLSYADPW